MEVISLINMKGGAGKSTTTHNLAGALAKLGKRVLAIDNDPQSSLTQGLLGPTVAEALDPAATIAAIYQGGTSPGAVIRGSGIGMVDLLPGSIASDEHNTPCPEQADWHAQTCLRDFLQELEGRYEVVLIDNPPNLHLCGWAALSASTWALIPCVPEDYGSQGLSPVRRSIARVRASVNPQLGLLGILLTQVAPRRAIHQLYESTLREKYGDAVFETRIPDAADFPEAVAHHLPVTHYKPRSAAAKASLSLAQEILDRIARSAADQAGEAA